MALAATVESRPACGVALVGVAKFGAAASYGRCGSTCSITSCAAAAVRAVINVERIPIHSVTIAMVTRIHFSRAEASGSVDSGDHGDCHAEDGNSLDVYHRTNGCGGARGD